MDHRLVNGLIALTGIASAIACAYVEDDGTKVALMGYAFTVLGYCKRRVGDVKATP